MSTLSYHDFRRSVTDAYSYWFLNFYSPQCSHCHDLAPTWRRVARQLEGVVRVGAVNCADDFMLCRQQNIRAYPSLIYYGPDGDVVKYESREEKAEAGLLRFIVDQLPDTMIRLNRATFKAKTSSSGGGSKKVSPDKPWLILYCSDDDEFKCPERYQRKLLGHTLHGLLNVGIADCSIGDWCDEHTGGEDGVFFYKEAAQIVSKEGRRLEKQELMRDMAKDVLESLP